jgi:hypothetical protein
MSAFIWIVGPWNVLRRREDSGLDRRAAGRVIAIGVGAGGGGDGLEKLTAGLGIELEATGDCSAGA